MASGDVVSDTCPGPCIKVPSPTEYATSMSFRDFRQKLEKDGFFQRNYFKAGAYARSHSRST